MGGGEEGEEGEAARTSRHYRMLGGKQGTATLPRCVCPQSDSSNQVCSCSIRQGCLIACYPRRTSSGRTSPAMLESPHCGSLKGLTTDFWNVLTLKSRVLSYDSKFLH